ncbi:MAG: hypothetical protein ABIT61_09550 [Steroidobacteraceae bacterium]
MLSCKQDRRRTILPYYGKYDSPDDLLRDDTVSYQEKLELLKSWRDDKEAYMRASEDGMAGDDRSDRLRQIASALTTLEENPPN